MKFRIIGTIVILLILGSLYAVFEDTHNQDNTVQQSTTQQQQPDSGLNTLKIN